jgi:hypothetical protein
MVYSNNCCLRSEAKSVTFPEFDKVPKRALPIVNSEIQDHRHGALRHAGRIYEDPPVTFLPELSLQVDVHS